MCDGPYYAEAGYVRKRSVETRHTDGSTTFILDFRICQMTKDVGPDTAEIVAVLMNAGHVALTEKE